MNSAAIMPPAPAPASFVQPFQFMPQCHACPYHKAVGGLRELFSAGPLAAPTVPPGISLEVAIEQVITAKRIAGLRPNSIKSMQCILEQFARGRESVPLASIGARDIESWLESRTEKATTRQSNIGRLSSLFSYHVRRDNITANPCRKLERTRIEHAAPVILTPTQADKLLRIAPEKFRPYLILGMFAGIRPEEITKLTWDDVCLDTKTITVNLAKTRRRRIVPLEPRAVALLESCRTKKGRIAPSKTSIRRYKRKTILRLGFKTWPHDLLRHTAASYLLALIGDAGRVSARLGNSSSILLTHYHQPVTKANCDKFWQASNIPPAPRLPRPKYDRAAIIAFYNGCKSYKKTQAQFNISSRGTLYYILCRDAARIVQTQPAKSRSPVS